MSEPAAHPLLRVPTAVGRVALDVVEEIGLIARFLFQSLREGIRPPYRIRNIFRQMETLGVNSMPVVLITAIFTGMVLALQTHTGFKRFNAESLVGTVVALSMTRELGPVLTGLITAGRAGETTSWTLAEDRSRFDAEVLEVTRPEPGASTDSSQ